MMGFLSGIGGKIIAGLAAAAALAFAVLRILSGAKQSGRDEVTAETLQEISDKRDTADAIRQDVANDTGAELADRMQRWDPTRR